jgi:hypothetical protein
MELGLITMNDPAQAVMIKAGSAMLGHLMLLLSMALSARYVILDAEGLLPRREPKPQVELNNKSSIAADDRRVWIDSPAPAPEPVLRRAESPAPSVPATSQPFFSSSPTPPAPVTRKLTKQEKKALRDRLLHEQAEREKKTSWK